MTELSEFLEKIRLGVLIAAAAGLILCVAAFSVMPDISRMAELSAEIEEFSGDLYGNGELPEGLGGKFYFGLSEEGAREQVLAMIGECGLSLYGALPGVSIRSAGADLPGISAARVSFSLKITYPEYLGFVDYVAGHLPYMSLIGEVKYRMEYSPSARSVFNLVVDLYGVI